jgi:hypothetical protein
MEADVTVLYDTRINPGKSLFPNTSRIWLFSNTVQSQKELVTRPELL